MTKNLVIVESPAKAKTIEKFLGKDFTVKSSFGHIRDLPSKGMNIDIENGFEPNYEVNTDKKKTVTELKKLAKSSDTVWLASDEDREGEAIAWHLKEALKLSDKKTKRIVFHEITKPAITKAIKEPRELDQNLVDAQQARRVLDRLVGYELSPVLWRKVKTGLSAGRVQSVAVRLIVEREQDIEAFASKSAFKVTAEFDLGDGKVLKAEHKKKFNSEKTAQKFLEELRDSVCTIEALEVSPAKRTPAAPFTTSTLQQEASRKIGFSVKKTMMVAQRLYEAGKITYMRTDSLNLSDMALEQAQKEITKDFGAEYVKIRKYKTKSAGAQEAHEAIRPTDLSKRTSPGSADEKRLYDLIWKRTIASQMAEAKLQKTVARIALSQSKEQLVAEGEVIKFPGFLEVYLESSDDEDESTLEKKMLPPLKEGQDLALSMAQARETFSRPPARFTEASLVKKMEEMGIGRPSTYAPTISTIQDRGYIEKTSKEGQQRAYKILKLIKKDITTEEKTETTGAEKNKLFPTDIGRVVNDFLVKHFPDIVDFTFTAKVERQFDHIAHGKLVWKTMIAKFYTPFHKTVTQAADISREDAVHMHEIGTHPKTKRPIFARIGRFGPMLQMGRKEDEEKPQFASIPKDKSMETITLEEALPLFELPRILGQDENGDDVIAQIGRFGPYVKVGKTFVSISQDKLFEIELDEAFALAKEKKEAAAKKVIQDFEKDGIQVLNGRYGPYVSNGKKNAKIPKDKKPEELTVEECKKLIDEAPEKKRRFVRRKKT